MIRRTFLSVCISGAASCTFAVPSSAIPPERRFQTWLELNQGFDPETQYLRLREAQRTVFWDELPEEISFLSPPGCVDLGFDDLGLSSRQCRRLIYAFSHTGVLAPDRSYRLRHAHFLCSVVEPVDGSEQATLPQYWKQAVSAFDLDDKVSWLGKKALRGRMRGFDLSEYRDIGEAFVPLK